MSIWVLIFIAAIIAFLAYEVWLSRTKGRIHIGVGGDVSKADAPRVFAVYCAAYWIGLIVLAVLTPMLVITFGVKL